MKLPKIPISLSSCTHTVIILFHVWAGIREQIKKRLQKSPPKKFKEVDFFDDLIFQSSLLQIFVVLDLCNKLRHLQKTGNYHVTEDLVIFVRFSLTFVEVGCMDNFSNKFIKVLPSSAQAQAKQAKFTLFPFDPATHTPPATPTPAGKVRKARKAQLQLNFNSIVTQYADAV